MSSIPLTSTPQLTAAQDVTDYVAVPLLSISVAANGIASIPITIVNDNDEEDCTEGFGLLIFGDVGATFTSALVFIGDDDGTTCESQLFIYVIQ